LKLKTQKKVFLKKKKYFNIKKYVKYDQIMEDLCSDEDVENDVKETKIRRGSRLRFINYKNGKKIN